MREKQYIDIYIYIYIFQQLYIYVYIYVYIFIFMYIFVYFFKPELGKRLLFVSAGEDEYLHQVILQSLLLMARRLLCIC